MQTGCSHDAIEHDVVDDHDVQLRAGANSMEDFKVEFDTGFVASIAQRLDKNEKIAGQLLDNPGLREALEAEYLPRIYAKARVARQRVCPIGELIGPSRPRSEEGDERPPLTAL